MLRADDEMCEASELTVDLFFIRFSGTF